MNGATVVSSGTIPPQPDVAWAVADVADFNGDGRADVLWRHGAAREQRRCG